MIPMFRTLARSAITSVATSLSYFLICSVLASSVGRVTGGSARMHPLPAVVSKCLVGFGHLVGVFTTLDARAEAVACVEQLIHEALGHGLLAAGLGVADKPAQRQRATAGALDLHRNLVGGTTHTATLDLKGRPHIVERALERNHRIG